MVLLAKTTHMAVAMEAVAAGAEKALRLARAARVEYLARVAVAVAEMMVQVAAGQGAQVDAEKSGFGRIR